MTRLKFDVTGVDPAGDFTVPKPGSYRCKIDVIDPKESKAGNEMLEVQYVITEDGEFQNARLWDYIVLTENQQWKYRRFLEAVGAVTGRKEKGEIDIDKLIGKRVLVKITNENSAEFGTRARVGSVASLKGADLNGDGEEDGEEGEEEGYSYEEIMEMSKTDLKELIDEEELEIRVTKQTKVASLREKVAEALELEEEGEEEEGEEDGEGDDEELTAEDVEGYNKAELKEVISENDLGIRVTKQTKLPQLRKKVLAKLIEEEMIEDPEAEEEGEEEEGEGEAEEVEDYAELDVADLRNELKERGLSTKGTKPALVKRLEKDDEETDAL